MHIIKVTKNKPITIFLSVLIAIALLLSTAIAVTRPAGAAEEKEDTTEFAPVSLSLSNPQFSSSSGDYPANPSSWTGEYVDGGKAELVKGVVDLTPSVYSTGGNKEYALDQYEDEYKSEKDIPKSIFGEGTDFGGDKKALFINTKKGASTVYAYKSEEMTLSANSFYRFSVWAKTGKFTAQSGATVKLSGLGQYFGFYNIDTARKNIDSNGKLVLDVNNNYGWVKYTLYVRTSASLSKSVRINLGLGETATGGNEDPGVYVRPASGYVFFDDVKADRISAFDFASETMHFEKLDGKDNVYGMGTSMAIDLNETKSFATKDGLEIGTFSRNTDQWKNARYDEYEENPEYTGSALLGFYNSEGRLKDLSSSANVYGFSQNPWAPYGRAEYASLSDKQLNFFESDRNGNILVISTYDGDEFTAAARGAASPFVTIERFKYYRFSVWVKGDSVEDGNGITIRLKGKLASANNVNLLTEYTSLAGDSSDTAHYGWKEQIVYIHGSMLYDYDVSFELWLGAPGAQSSGIAMFDNVTFTELKYSDYSAMSEADSGNFYAIDDNANASNITNGNFVDVDDMDEIKFPMPAAEWSYLTTEEVGTRGFSVSAVDTENAVHGIIPTDEKTFAEIAASGAIPYPDMPKAEGLTNVLMLASSTKTAFCYQSPSITIATDTAYKITVDMMVGRVDGYGASLVLKTTSGNVISTIENIQNTNKQFRTYTFYLSAPRSQQTVYLEIWLGLNDRKDNKQKLSSGNVYVKLVDLVEWTAADDGNITDEFNAILEKYKSDINSTAALGAMNYGIYSFSEPTLDYYDAYSYDQMGGLGTPYQWSRSSANSNVISGIFNTLNVKEELYPGFEKKDLSGSMLYIYNTEKNYTKYTYDNSLSLVSNKYYRIDVQVKVRISSEELKDKNSVGAGLALTGSSASFTNIKDTSTIYDVNNEDSRDYETFKKYSFYISTGDNGGDVGLDITFGGEDKESYIQGRLIIGSIVMTEIDNLDYEDAQKSKDKNIIAVELSETVTDNSTNNNTEAASSDIQWWIIPTVIFSVALVAAIVLILVIRLRDYFKKKRKVTYATQYGREDAYDDIERLRAQIESDKQKKQEPAPKTQTDDLYEESPVLTDGEATETEESETETEQPETPTEEPKKPDTDLDD
ncbi:MAG: hypothetical protein J1F71_01185 [Clostridiales bacterium]|nr:hypothetical protein [Clostridiales bacterium]